MRLKPLHLLIMSLLAALILTTMTARANTDQLYELSGMATHQTHFQHALTAAQQRYAQQLPRNVYDSLVRQSNQRFAPQAMTDRAQARLALAINESSYQQAVAFYQSALGRKIVAIETQATSATSVAAMQRGIPEMDVGTERLNTLRQLSVSLPALEPTWPLRAPTTCWAVFSRYPATSQTTAATPCADKCSRIFPTPWLTSTAI